MFTRRGASLKPCVLAYSWREAEKEMDGPWIDFLTDSEYGLTHERAMAEIEQDHAAGKVSEDVYNRVLRRLSGQGRRPLPAPRPVVNPGVDELVNDPRDR